ncbi:MAG TPA: hypothetical protein VLB44_11770, partial [Kofleriaceae bacterium]|nr:hypothetical protein [Kofleriaceae bacterium]
MFRWFTIICLVGGCDVVFQIDHVPPWSSVAAGNGHTCALRDDHTLYCWGDNSDGQLGVGESPIEADTPIQVESAWQAVSTSNTSTCAIDVDRFLWCWGRNLEGQVGLGNASSASVPQKLEGTWTQISVGSGHACGIRDNGSLWCWGSNMYGQLGDGTISSQFSPTQISTDHWSSVSAGQRHTCGVEADGSLWCWGRDRDGELGDGMLRDMSTSPVLVGTDRWAQVVTGGGTVDNNSSGVTCGRTIDGHVRCWGAGAFGTIGDDRKLSSAVPTDVLISGAVVTDWVDIAMTGLHACGRRADGTLWCWGDDSRGQVGTDLPAAVATSPLQVIGGSSRWDALAAGSDHTCAVGNGELWCFGGEAHGQFGRGVGSHRRPVLASAGPWSAVSAGGAHTCVLDRAGGVSCGGDNSFAQLGDATRIAEKHLVQISAPGMSSITAGSDHTCSIATDRTLWCWGYNGRGALGDGTTQRASMPEQVSTEPWTSVSAKQQTCGIRPDGSLWCWGYNYYGQVGNGSTTDPIVTPAQVQAGTSWKAVAAGGVASCG